MSLVTDFLGLTAHTVLLYIPKLSRPSSSAGGSGPSQGEDQDFDGQNGVQANGGDGYDAGLMDAQVPIVTSFVLYPLKF